MRPLKVALLQAEPGGGIESGYLSIIRAEKPDVIAFPEYFFVQPGLDNVASSISSRDSILSQLIAWSVEFGCIIVGGTLVDMERDELRNRCFLINRGNIVGYYDKIHLFRNEGGGRIMLGKNPAVFDVEGLRIGLLVCADVLYLESFEKLAPLRPDLTFVPTTSPYKPNESAAEKFARDREIFARGAETSGSLLFKVSACGTIVGRPLQGRSLIAGPGKIYWRIEPEDEHRSALIIANVRPGNINHLLDISVYHQ